MAQRKIYDMSKNASGQSIDWLRRQYRLAQKAANDRIKTTTKNAALREHAQAYNHIVRNDLQGKKYISEKDGVSRFAGLGKKASRAELMEALKAAERFLGSRTSTAGGIRELIEERRKNLNDYLQEDWENRGGSGSAPKLSKDEADNILRWLGSPEGQAAKRDFDSHQVREAIAKKVIANRLSGTKQSVSQIYNEFVQSELTFADYISESEEILSQHLESF